MKNAVDYFLVHFEILDNGCWQWTGYIAPNGYGQLYTRATTVSAHVFAYELFKGEIPRGLQIDHLCRNRACVNSWHLEAVTAKENARRGNPGLITGARQKAKTHCPHKHPYSEENTHVSASGERTCRTCARLNARIKRSANHEV